MHEGGFVLPSSAVSVVHQMNDGAMIMIAAIKNITSSVALAGLALLGLNASAAERDTTLNALAVEAFNDLLKKRGKQPVVQNPLAAED